MYFPWAGNLGRWSINIKTHEVICNPLKVEALGYSMEELDPVYEFFTKLLHPEDYEPTMEAMRKHLRGETPAYEAEYRIRSKDGEYKWFYDRGIITERDEEGYPVWVAGIVFDISEQKSKQEELQRLVSEKDKFISILAHDLKNPFSGFLGLTEMLSTDYESFSTEEVREYHREMYASASQVYKLLENLLDWARLQRGAVEYIPRSLALQSVVEDISDLSGATAKQKHIRIRTEVPENLVVYADPHMLQTILRNLITNAIKFTHEHGSVEISATEITDGKTLIEVSDDGIGMDRETIDAVFHHPETSAVSARGTSDESGTGLGLIVTRELVELHGGSISAESTPGEGSTISFTLPLAESE